MIGQAFKTDALPLQQSGEIRAKIRIGQKENAQNRQRWTQAAAGRLQQGDDTNTEDNNIGGIRVCGAITQQLAPQAGDNRHVCGKIIKCAGRPQKHNNPIRDRNIGSWAALERRIGHEGQYQSEGQVNGAGIFTGKGTKADFIGDGGCDPNLKQGPQQGNRRHSKNQCLIGWRAAPGIIGSNEIVQFRLAETCLVILIAHHQIPLRMTCCNTKSVFNIYYQAN